jgi:hypothetical protein
MEGDRHRLRDDFLKSLSNYSLCIQPYVRNVQEKYGTAYYLTEGEEVDFSAYC